MSTGKVFTFEPASCVPFRDREVLERCRNIKREDMEKHWNPEFKIKIVNDVPSLFIADVFTRIKMSDDLDQRVVLIFPNPWPSAYSNVAELINRFNVNCRNVHTFCEDEWADQDGNVAPLDYKAGFGYSFKKYFFGNIRPDLRMPEEQVHVFTTENVYHYSDIIDEVGNGGADVIYNGCGWPGHTCFIDPSPEFQNDTVSLEEFKKMGSRIVTMHPLSIAENSLLPVTGSSGDVANVPPKAATIGPRDMQHARDRFDFHCFAELGGFTSWERMISRVGLYGPVTPLVPYSLNQELKCSVYVSEDVAKPFGCMESGGPF